MFCRIVCMGCMVAMAPGCAEGLQGETVPTALPSLPTDSDTGMAPSPGIVPENIGFALDGAMDATGTLVERTVGLGGRALSPSIVLRFVTADFIAGADDREAESCTALATIPEAQRSPLSEDEQFANGDGAPMFQAYEVTLDIGATDCPDRVDTATFGADAGGLLDRFDGITLGVGLAPPDQSSLQKVVELPEELTNLVVQYVALPYGLGSFTGVPVSVGFAFELDPKTGDPQLDAAGEPIETDLSGQEVTVPIGPTDLLSQTLRYAAIASIPDLGN